MIVRCCTFDEMTKQIELNHAKIIMVGAGVIGTVTTPAILKNYGSSHNVECYIDNNSKLWNTNIKLEGKAVPVYSMEFFKNMTNEPRVILLNISRYSDILRHLNSMVQLKNVICYIIPMMCVHNYSKTEDTGAVKDYNLPQIPKVIHYMWLGKKSMPDHLIKCVDSWKRFCPDYEIIQWDEENYDINKHFYMKEAYECKAYGFVPDYARLDILYQHGGIYMDTDVELIRPLDDLLYEDAFCGVEKWQVLNFGGCSGAVRGNDMIRQFLVNREQIHFLNQDGSQNRITCGYYDTRVAIENGYRINGTVQKLKNMNIYTSDYFHPYDYMSGRTEITKNTFSVHRFQGGWLTEAMKKENDAARREFDALYMNALKESKEKGVWNQ